MTEPAEPEHVETSPPSAAARRSGGENAIRYLAVDGFARRRGVSVGWPWAEQTWQRFEAIESKLVSIEQKETATPPAEIAKIASASADREIRNAMATAESEWRERLRRARLVKCGIERSLSATATG